MHMNVSKKVSLLQFSWYTQYKTWSLLQGCSEYTALHKVLSVSTVKSIASIDTSDNITGQGDVEQRSPTQYNFLLILLVKKNYAYQSACYRKRPECG